MVSKYVFAFHCCNTPNHCLIELVSQAQVFGFGTVLFRNMPFKNMLFKDYGLGDPGQLH